MIFMLDNYDSFTYNLVQRFGEIDSRLEVRVERNNQITVDEIAALKPQAIVVSPGPCTPHEAGISMELIRRLGPSIPTLGVCLGHQSLAEVYGAKVVRAERLMHGKVSEIHHTNQGVFAGLPNPFIATRYHSLVVPEETVPPELQVTAWVDYPGHPREVMGLQHRDFPVHGVQFHPESFLTAENGIQLLRNFLGIAGVLPELRGVEPLSREGNMAAVEWIVGFQTTVGGEPHTGWLPPNAAIPLPTPIRNVELDLAIEVDGDGYLLIFESRDGTVRGDTWHSTIANAHDAAKRYFGVSTEAWSST